MDSFQARSVRVLKKRHEDQIRQNAQYIQEHIGYVLQCLDRGQSASVRFHASGLEAAAREIRIRAAALEAIEEALGILDIGDGDPS